MSYQNKICWITGASSGIGEALCYQLAKQGAKLILSARNESKLRAVSEACIKLGAVEALVLPVDLGSESTIDNAVELFNERFNTIDLLVNNGGISQRALSIDTSYEVERNIMQVNYFGTIYLTKKMLPKFVNQKFGQIAVTSSIAGKFGFPLRTTYSASKHAVQGYFESLRTELLEHCIDISVIIPGRIRTEISKHALDGEGASTNKMDKGLDEGMNPDKAARTIVIGLAKKKKEILVGGKELLLVHIRRLFPWLYYKIVSKISPT